ncbi:MAG TPA: peptidoglycan-associated lipoprotein Pal [Gemmatimonadales bacterium]|nr:peptidoglycan-associated lipoprotein Pal [Gemmatimonadales bacterium]
MHTTTRVALLALLVATAACGAKPAPEQPLPEPQPVTPTVNADSIRAAQEAAERARRTADSLAAAQRDSAVRAANAATAAARAEAERMFADQIHFDYDKFDIRTDDQGILDWKARLLAANPVMTIRISGHADERGSDEYNLALGNRRAAAAKRYLVNKGIAESRISTDSYGEERPLDTGSTEEAWARNRRDEFVITAAPATWTLPTP